MLNPSAYQIHASSTFELYNRWFAIHEERHPQDGSYVAVEYFGHIEIEPYEGQACLGVVVELRPYKYRPLSGLS
jgi:hypothetical protein